MFRAIKRFFQRHTKGYDDMQIWNLSNTISDFILIRLKAYRNMERSGYPSGLSKNELTEQQSFELWNSYLDSMIEAFTIISEDDFTPDDVLKNINVKFKKPEGEDAIGTEGYRIVETDITKSERKKIKNYAKKQNKKVRKGLKLFTTHLQSLWD